MLFLKQSTASQDVLIGPFVDDTDGASPETGLTIANTDIRLSKNGGNLAAKNSGGATHDEAGWYQITLDATDTDTVGTLQLHVKVVGALMVHAEFHVLAGPIYDALIASSAAAFDSNQRVDVGSFLGNAVQITDSRPEAVAERLGTQAKADVNAEADTALTDYDAVVPADLNDPTAAAIADAVWDEARSAHVSAGTFGEGVKAEELNSQAKADVNAELVDVVGTDVIPDSVASDGSRPTMRQALLMITRFLFEKAASGTTISVKKEDGSTESMTFTLDDADAPTSITRAS